MPMINNFTDLPSHSVLLSTSGTAKPSHNKTAVAAPAPAEVALVSNIIRDMTNAVKIDPKNAPRYVLPIPFALVFSISFEVNFISLPQIFPNPAGEYQNEPITI